ncbi:MAG: response regulator transcription factor [Chitinophagaceae bacterium]|nr:MAG: response regulator transcription factor [Chitinophagaceae bacterium]
MEANGFTYLIADDDPVYREIISNQLALIPGLTCIAVCDSAIAALAQLKHSSPDLLILDIEMPGLTGIELAKSLSSLPMIIFISSHSSYAADAFDVDALDYLVKPVAMHRLIRAIDKARQMAELKRALPVGDSLRQDDEQSFFIRDKNSYVRIAYEQVQYIESLGDFVNIYLTDGDKKIALVNLKNMEQQLPASKFIRISRTHMVNKDKITAVDSNFVSLNKIQLPVGKTYADAVQQAVVGSNAIRRFI